jgi:preprotein translocase subunit SecB
MSPYRLHLKKNKATHLELRPAVEDEHNSDGYVLHHRTIFEEDQNNSFIVEFRLEMTIENSHRLIVQYASEFVTDPEFDDDFKKSGFVRINAPAIAFPFIRSYVAHITLIAGFESVILPSVNFTVQGDDIKPFDFGKSK